MTNEQTRPEMDRFWERMQTIYQRHIADTQQEWVFLEGNPQQITRFHSAPYRPLPGDELLLAEPWRVVIHLQTVEKRSWAIGLDLYGEIIMGRAHSEPGKIVLDLSRYDMRRLGVSRHHLMINPTPRNLVVTDLESKHGVTVNEQQLEPNMPTLIDNGDRILLGKKVGFFIYVLDRPEDDATVW